MQKIGYWINEMFYTEIYIEFTELHYLIIVPRILQERTLKIFKNLKKFLETVFQDHLWRVSTKASSTVSPESPKNLTGSPQELSQRVFLRVSQKKYSRGVFRSFSKRFWENSWMCTFMNSSTWSESYKADQKVLYKFM